MSTTRYFLGGHVRLTYLDRAPGFADLRGGYRCFIKSDKGERRTIIVGEPRVLDKPVDCPEAFDDAARAAIAFATDFDCSRDALLRGDDMTEPLDLEYDFETVDAGGCACDRIAVRRQR